MRRAHHNEEAPKLAATGSEKEGGAAGGKKGEKGAVGLFGGWGSGVAGALQQVMVW